MRITIADLIEGGRAIRGVAVYISGDLEAACEVSYTDKADMVWLEPNELRGAVGPFKPEDLIVA